MRRRVVTTCLASFAALVMAAGSAVPAQADTTGDKPVRTVTLETHTPRGLDAGEATVSEGAASGSRSVEDRKKRIPKDSPAVQEERLDALQNASTKRVPLSAADCQKLTAAQRDVGLVVDHFTWCKVGIHTLTVKECLFSFCRETGRATFRLSTLGQASNGSRDVSFVTLMDDIDVSGEAAVEPVTIDMECTVFNGSACTADPLNGGQTQTMTAWAVSPSAFFTFTSPTAGATGTDLMSWYDFEGSVSAQDETVSTGSNGFRCDSASYLPNKLGCVFDLTQELWYDLSTSNPEVNESAQHILDAQERPELTVPPWTGKTVPGSIFSGQPLTRVYYDMTLRNANRAKARATCTQYWGTYSDLGLDCDEYPFSTTLEGAAAGDDRYSARALDAADNQKAGSMLGVFYGRQRVLDNDTFYVIIIP